MSERVVTIVNARGLHARAAAKFVTVSERYDAAVEVIYDGQSVYASSIMGLLMLGAAMGATVMLRAEGDDKEAALDALESLIAAGFNEGD